MALENPKSNFASSREAFLAANASFTPEERKELKEWVTVRDACKKQMKLALLHITALETTATLRKLQEEA